MRQRPLASVPGRTLRALRRGLAVLPVAAITAGLLVATPMPATAVTDGPLLWYKLDETSGTTAGDASGHERNGTVHGTAGWSGSQGLAFDGSSTYVTLPDNVLAGLTSVTVATDVYVDPAQATPYFVYGLGNTTTWYGDGYLFATGDRLRAAIASGNWSTEQNTEPSPSRNLARGGWKHLAYTQTGTTGILYEDGVEVARNTSVTITPGSIKNGTTTANYLGKSNYTGDKLLKGRLRDFRLYDRALDPSEVGELARPAVTESVTAEAAALSLGDTGAVTGDLTLPTRGNLGSAITWASSDPAVVRPNGTVSRPAAGAPDAHVTLTATLTKGDVTRSRTFAVTVLATFDDGTTAKAAADALVVHGADDVRGNLTLPTTGQHGTTVTWASSNPAVISATGVVHRPAAGSAAATVTLTATVTSKTATATRDITATVPALPAPAAKTGYLFSYFTGEGTADGEQLHFALSHGNDPLAWSELNGGKPVLTSTLGTKGLRDPFIIRSPEGDKFYQIATDLRIYGNGDWDGSQRTGSKSIMVWESTDLVHWTDQRLVKVSPDTAGNTWAPEAFYDKTLGAYVVFWASKLYAADDPDHTGSTHNKMMYATTRDFWTFSEPKVWKDPGYSVIDSTVTEHDGTYYRFTKDERNNSSSTPCSKFIVQEKSASLLDPNWDLVAECLGKGSVSAGEGPSIFKSNVEDKWYLFIDEFGGRGYVPFSTTNLASGTWTMEPKYSLPSSPRHGTVIGITQAEWDRLKATYDPPKTVTSVDDVRLDTAVGVAPQLPGTVTATFADGTRGPVGVTWGQLPPSAYAAPGTFTVEGTVAGNAAGSTVKARAVVTVVTENPGLLVHYRFDETGGTVATDSSGRGNNGTYVNNPTFGGGRVGGAVVLAGGAAGSNAPYVSIPNGVLAGAQDLTVATWVTWSGTGGGGQWIYGLGLDSNRYVFSGPNWSGSAVLRSGITLNSWQAEKGMTSTSGLPSGSWQHLAVTIDSTAQTATMYLGGTAIATATGVTIKPADLYDAAKSVSGYIGKSFFSADPYLAGAVDDFRVYTRALPADEIARLAGSSTDIKSVTVAGSKVPPIVHADSSTVTLPMRPGTTLTALAPEFTLSTGATISPASGSTQDFSSPVTYTVTGADGTQRTWTVKALVMKSPVVPGLYADPNIIAFGDRYYLYPTTDGFDGWSGTQFHAFSSKDLVNWTDHGVILDLGPDVSWADSRAWAPTIAQKDGKYYFYFCAEAQLGVAVGDSPTGPFTDALGKPLVAAGTFSGQMIDPHVFRDDDGSYYLYWGNGNAYVVKLDPDMVSFDRATVKTITPPGYNEGTFVFKRQGTYYLSWSENDTRDENYRVAYATGTSPTGPWTKRGVILSKDLSQGIKGTGHHSVVAVPGTDDWYIAYHRFAIPGGDGMHRETTVDRLTFNADGTIAPVVPTLTSVPGQTIPDLTGPVATASVTPAAPASGWHTAGPVTVTITARDAVDGVVTPQAKVTGPGSAGQWTPVTAPLTLTADGDHVVEYRAVDSTGNVSEVKSVRVRLDSTPPVSTAAVDETGRTVTLTATDALSGVARVEFSTNGGSTWTPYTTPIAVGPAATTITYRGVDVAGNTESANRVVVPDGGGTDLAPSRVAATLTSTTVAYGNASRVNVTVTGGLPTKPTGTIRVLDGSTEVGTGTLSANGKETVTLAADLAVGVRTLKVLYSGDARYAASEASVTLTVVKAATRTQLSISKSGIKTGRTNRATIDVSAATKATVTGTVTLRIVGAGWDTTFAAHLENGKAVVDLGPFTTPGTVTAVASYPGSDALEASASAGATFTVG